MRRSRLAPGSTWIPWPSGAASKWIAEAVRARLSVGVLVLVLISGFLESPAPVGAQPASDVFFDALHGTTLDPAHWQPIVQPGTNGSIEARADGVHFKLLANNPAPSFSLNLKLVPVLRGDFDVSVDYRLMTWPTRSGVRSGLNDSKIGAVSRSFAGVGEAGSDQHLTHFAFVGDGVAGVVPTSDPQGRIRFTRTGRIYAGYRWNGTSWVLLRSFTGQRSGDIVDLNFGMWSGAAVWSGQDVEMVIENFRITAGMLGAGPSGPYTLTDDFSTYTTGQAPTGWEQFGTPAVTPIIEQVGGTTSAFKQLHFGSLGGGQTDKHLVRQDLSCTDVTATVKLSFQENADSAGLIVAWSDTNSHIKVQANAFHDLIGFNEFSNGIWRTRIEVPVGTPINVGASYWLRVTLGTNANGSKTAVVYWSTDGTNYVTITSVPNLERFAGRVGLNTAGVNLPHVHFDDFSIAGTCQVTASGPTRFLTLPFPQDPEMRIQQAWTSSFDANHHGIDYIKGTLNDSDGTVSGSPWGSFPVLAAADGDACGNCASGPTGSNSVWIRHATVEGTTYYTYYGHLSSVGTVAQPIPLESKNNTVRVTRGQVIGIAGATGVRDAQGVAQPDWIHLHFEVHAVKDGIDRKVDPYALDSVAANYPDPNATNGRQSGTEHLWTTNSPSHPVAAPVTAGGLTKLSGVAAAGASLLEVASSVGFAPGDFVRISPGRPNQEDARVATLGSLVLAAPLRFSHEANAEVVRLTVSDSKPPQTSAALSPASNGSSWNPSDVTITLQATDDEGGSGVKEILYSATGAQTIASTRAMGSSAEFAITNEGRTSVVFGAQDNVGNVETPAKTLDVKIDKTAPNAPLLTADRAPEYAGGGGWHRNTVTATFAASGDPKLADATDGSGVDLSSVPASVTRTTSGEQTVTGSVKDVAGNFSAPASLTIRVDATPPTVTLVCPTTPVVKGSTATASWTAADQHSGLTTPTSGNVSLDTSTVGPKTATLLAGSARDNVGLQSAPATCGYAVVYQFTGFFQPVDNPPTINQGNAGRAVPVKFSLGGNQGLGIFATGAPSSQQVSCSTAAPIAELEETSTAGSSELTYDASADRYSYVWKTEASWTGTCRQLVVKLNDGTEHLALFRFR